MSEDSRKEKVRRSHGGEFITAEKLKGSEKARGEIRGNEGMTTGNKRAWGGKIL